MDDLNRARIGGLGEMVGHPPTHSQSLLSLCLCLFRSYIYQKRWVRLDTDYLRYFDSNKVRAPSVPQLTLAPAWA